MDSKLFVNHNKMNRKLSSELALDRKQNNYKKNSVFSILDSVRSMYNVGSIFRTSDAIGIQKIFLTGITAYPPRKAINKTALGAVDSVDWQYFSHPLSAISLLKKKEKNIRIISVEQTKYSKSMLDFKMSFPIAFIFGNEINGIQSKLLEASDEIIEIPMYGQKHSLNLSVAYGIILYFVLGPWLQKINP